MLNDRVAKFPSGSDILHTLFVCCDRWDTIFAINMSIPGKAGYGDT